MTASRSPGLTIEHQQLLAFVSTYLRHYGCLPTATETALGCGFRSPRPVARLLNELEALGVLRRDEHYGRLGSIEVSPLLPALDEQDQLWLSECAVVEHRACLRELHVGLEFAPDFDTIAAIHAEGVTRATVLRSHEHARMLLRDGGSTLTPDGEVELRTMRATMADVRALMIDWPTYCVVQLVWTLSAHQWLAETQPMQLGYIGATSVASLRATESQLPIYRTRSGDVVKNDPRVPELLRSVSKLLDQLRASIGRHFPSRPDRLTVDVHSLLAG